MEDGYFLTFTEVSPVAVGVGMLETQDFKSFRHHGMIFPPHNKDCALFEEKIGDKYYASIVQVVLNWVAIIWIAESPDRVHWGNHVCIATTRNGHFDSAV